MLGPSLSAYDPTRTVGDWAIFVRLVIDTAPSADHIFLWVDTTCRLQPFGHGERIAASYRLCTRTTGQQRKP
jgi:hypothetical protein